MNNPTPHDYGAERRIISTIAAFPELYREAASLSPAHFHHFDNAATWGKLAADIQHERPIILADYENYYEPDLTPLPEYVREDARRILVTALARAALTQASSIAKAAYAENENEIRQAIRAAEDVMTIGAQVEFSTLGQAALKLHDELSEPNNNANKVTTGMRLIDNAFGGGFRRKTLTTIMGRPGSGKTSLLNQISDLANAAGMITAVFSKEESLEEWASRIAFRRANVSLLEYEQNKVRPDEVSALSLQIQAAAQRQTLIIDDTPTQTTPDVWAVCDRIAQQYGRLDLIIADHLRLFSDTADNETHRLGKISWGLKQLSKKFNAAAVVGAQLSRAVENSSDKKPDLKDLRDSGEIEENSDNVIGLYRERYYDPQADNTAELWVRKARKGARNAVIRYAFIEKMMSFYELAEVPHGKKCD